MTVNEALRERFGIDLGWTLRTQGPSGVEGALRSLLHDAAERALDLGGPSGGTEVELAHLADLMAHLFLAFNGCGYMPSSIDRITE
ncbi:MAG TPA: hypothetical protein VM537_34435 [Anaerolineae bacterium]|nr:hypothetical protein [Anaerolineae bacterium]